MAHSPVTGEANGHAAMLNDGLMAPLQNVLDKLLCAALADLGLGLVAGASGQLSQRERRSK